MTEPASAVPAHADAVLGLGSNIGDKAGNIARALDLLEERGDVRVVRRSPLYRSEPWGVKDQDWFVNACAGVATSLSPIELLERCLAVETEMGRVRQQRWGPRLIDIDVLTYGTQTIDTERLKLPHPLIEQRAFVLAPMSDIAPDIVVRGKTVRAWLAVADTHGLTRL